MVLLSDGEALRKDAAEYAKDQGVSLDEAVKRLELQNAIGQFEVELSSKEPNTFGGLYIQHRPYFKVIVNTTGTSDTIKGHAQTTPIADLIEVRKVSRSLKQLEARQQLVTGTLASLGIPSETSIDVYKNLVDLQVLDSTQLKSVLKAIGKLNVLENVATVDVNSFMSMTVDAYAGNNMSCTSGYSVRDSHGLRGITTAGHCNNSLSYNATSYNATSLRFIREWFGSQDLQWHTSSSLTFRPWARDNEPTSGGTPYYREIYDNANRSTQPIGAFVCKYGLNTKHTCGYLNSKTVKPGAPYDVATYMRTGRGDGVVRSAPGDSGGPVYVGHQAWGLTHGGYFKDSAHPNYGDHVYMATNYITDTGLIVLFAPR
jgi:hypothetical protein